jgi:hypothetical protein
MCLSPEVDFTAGVAIGAVGVATLRLVRHPRDLLVAALPLGFGLHQFTEGFVWLGLRDQVSAGLGDAARDAYVVYAQAVLPMVVPLGFALMERRPERRRWIWPFVALGLAVGLYLLWQVTQYPIVAEEREHCVAYTTNTPLEIESATAYVLAVTVPVLLSSRRHLRIYGVVNVLGLACAAFVREEEFTSVWCLYAAVMSVLIWWHFRADRASPPAAGCPPPATGDPPAATPVPPPPRRTSAPPGPGDPG